MHEGIHTNQQKFDQQFLNAPHQDLYPAVTAGLVTAGYVLVYWLSPSLVTLASCLCLVATLLDSLVPLLADMIIPRSVLY